MCVCEYACVCGLCVRERERERERYRVMGYVSKEGGLEASKSIVIGS